MRASRFDLEEAAAILARTPGVLRALLSELPQEWVESDEGEGTFSARDVVAHLCSGEEHDWIPRARIILEHGAERPFEPFDRFAFRDRYQALTMAELLDEFATLRATSLAALRALELEVGDLARAGMHPELGRVTLVQLLSTWVVHDQGHIAQIMRVLSKRYADDVGPWSAYLPILTR
ncbi:MAG: DinB family protein [bacterium]|nr:DinB family protein [bacterium]